MQPVVLVRLAQVLPRVELQAPLDDGSAELVINATSSELNVTVNCRVNIA